MKILSSRSIYYDDVNLIAQPNKVLVSRKDVPRELWRIMVSPMPAIVGETFALEAARLGLSVCLHRFGSVDRQLAIYERVKTTYPDALVWASIGLDDEDRLRRLHELGCSNFILDVANGYLKAVVNYANKLSANLGMMLMVGNVHTRAGVLPYCNGRPFVRIGISNGMACDTKIVTGVNRGQITELQECCAVKSYWPVADGGIKDGGCAAKAFGCGALSIMLGGYFRNAKEAQNVIDGEYKFWGCASKFNQAKFGEVRRHSEGKVLEVDKDSTVPLSELVEDLWGGISSAVSYGGYRTLSDFIGNGVFELKHGS